MPSRFRRRTAVAVAGLAAVATLAACSGSSDGSAGAGTSADTSGLAFHGCGQVACTGTLDGAAYQIEMPATWNGTLLLWSHGYRRALSTPPDFGPVNTAAEDAPVRGDGAGSFDTSTAKGLLAQGYALAGSAYARNGWAVQDGVAAGEQLRQFFVDHVGTPRRTYVWGESLGGLISELLNEKHPDWVSGAAPQCGAVAGTTENLDGALAIAYMVRTLIDPGLKITRYDSAHEAIAAFERTQKKVTAAAQDVAGGGTAKVVAIAAIANLADKTIRFDAHDPVSAVSAKVEDILNAMGFATFGQQEFAERVGGQGLDISGFDFGSAVTEADRATVQQFGGDMDAYLRQLAAGHRPAVDAAARSAAKAQGETTGRIAQPTVTLHTEDDPLVPVSNERVLGDRVFQAGKIGQLVQLYTKAPTTYSAPAPYGAGHCNFTSTEELGLIRVLDGWVRTGTRPTPDAEHADFASPTGLDTTFSPLPFPLLHS